MASAVGPDLAPRFLSTQAQSAQRRSLDDVHRENGVTEQAIGAYQHSSSFPREAPTSSESDAADHCEGVPIVNGAGSITANSPVAGGQSVENVDEDEDGDDDVFDATPSAVVLDSKHSHILDNVDGQYDDLSSFGPAAGQQDDTQQRPHLESDSSKKLPAAVVGNRRNTSTSINSMATTSSIVDFTNKNHRHLQQPIVLDACSLVAESSSGSPTGISLFEKLVRTHPIWYLPHIGRVAAVHLLRGKPPGVFIVRRSSQPNSMAISINLPPDANQDIEHYLIETTLAGVHLEGSPNYFRELPFLLAYYCEHGDELHTTLTLPKAILECESLRDLCSLALLGPEFWTSSHCASGVPTVFGDCTESKSSSRAGMPSPPVRLKEESGTIENGTDAIAQSGDVTPRRLDLNGKDVQQSSSSAHRRSLSIGGYPGAANRIMDHDPMMLEGIECGFRKPAPFPNPTTTPEEKVLPTPEALPKKPIAKERSILSKFRSESVSGSSKLDEEREKVKNQRPSDAQQERRSFRLRNLFDVGRRPNPGCPPLPSPKDQEQRKFGSLTSSKSKKAKQVAPTRSNTITSTETDLALSKAARQQQATFYVHGRPAPPPPLLSDRPLDAKRTLPTMPAPQLEKHNCDHEYYYFSPASLPSPSLGAALNESRSVSSLLQEAVSSDERQRTPLDTPTMTRKRLLTFKPSSPTGNDEDATPTISSAETTLERRAVLKPAPSLQTLPMDKQSKPDPLSKQRSPVSPQPMAAPFGRPSLLRREKSDLGWLSGSCVESSTRYAGDLAKMSHSQQRQAILPPENKEENFKTCVEELRKRRLDALRQQMVSNVPILHSRRDGSPHIVSPGSTLSKKSVGPVSSGATQNSRMSPIATNPISRPGNFGSDPSASPGKSVLRTKSTRQHDGITGGRPAHRLSAPNLVDLPPNPSSPTSSLAKQRTVTELLRELRSRQPKPTPANGGGLSTINEGLVTPMARRRRAAAAKQQDGTAERRLSQSLEDLPAVTADQPILLPERGSSSGKALKIDSSNRRGQRQESDPVFDASSTDSISPSISRRNEKAFHDETNFQWVAVTNEIRQKQKVAKVAPTRSPYVSQTSCGSAASMGNKYSDYVMLNECADMLSAINGQNQNEDLEYGSGRYGSIGGMEIRRRDSQAGNASVPTSAGYLNAHQQFQDDIDDTRSVVSTAGTVFNEPWDSSVWENLLTLASSMDKEPANRITMDSRSSLATNRSSAASSNRPSRSDNLAVTKDRNDSSLSVLSKDYESKQKPHQKSSNRQPTVSWTERLKKLKENNIPPPLAPNWEEFSSHVPMSSDSSLPTSTPTNSLESRRKSLQTAAAQMKRDTVLGRKSNSSNPPQDDDAFFGEDRFNLAPVASPLRFRNGVASNSRRGDRSTKRSAADPGTRIQECVERLANDIQTFFGAQVQYFIKCTNEGHETDPLIVLGNVRQFMNGLKNYLVKQGECDLHPLIEQERSKLRPTEFLNIDAILEGVLQKIILAPLKPHLYHLLVKDGSTNGSLETLSENLAVIRNRSLADLGINTDSCDSTTMEQVRKFLRKMQHHYSPLKKLEYLLNAVALAYESCQLSTAASNGRRQPSTTQLPCADELLRWFVYLVSRCSMVGCEIESLYMWNLLHPALLAGESSYYLTAFSSAVHVLKNVDLLPRLNDACSLSSQMGDGGEGFIKVAVPDEISGAIRYHGFPIMPQLTVARLCRMIARKCGITNPEDYGLYLLIDGYETCLLSTECPEGVKDHLRTANKAHRFAYKRHEAKIAWPKIAVSPRL